MTLVVPTATSIKMRFPEFVMIDDPVVEFAIEEAALEFGDGSNWTSGANIALSYLVAHYVASAISRASSGGDGVEDGEIASESFGRLSISYVSKANVVAADKSTSSYGQRYIELLAGNFSGAIII